jgi:hypothetical protein
VLSLTLIKLFYFHRHSLYDRYVFVSPASFFIMTSVIRTGSRAAFSRFIGTSRSADLSHPKLSSIAFSKRPAGATSDISGNGEFSKRLRKLINPSDRIYVAPLRRLLCQRCARRYITISDKNFPSYFIPDRRIRYIY